MTARPLVRPAVVLLLPLALVGCGTASAPDDVALASDNALQVRSAGVIEPAGLVLPLDAYALSAADDQVLARAAEERVLACAESFGLDAAAVSPLPFGSAEAASAAADTRHDRRYAVADPEVAATYGYHPPVVVDVREEFYAAHTEAELEVLVGAGGCLGEASRAYAIGDEAGLRAGEELVSEVQASAWHSTLADARVLEAFAEWSACMAAAGYDYAAPMSANDDPRWWESEVAGAEEIAAAVADVACKSSTGLVDVWSGVEAEHQTQVIAANSEELAAYRSLLDQQVAAAR